MPPIRPAGAVWGGGAGDADAAGRARRGLDPGEASGVLTERGLQRGTAHLCNNRARRGVDPGEASGVLTERSLQRGTAHLCNNLTEPGGAWTPGRLPGYSLSVAFNEVRAGKSENATQEPRA
eukprot:8511409-Pyramimonas_sp.AAC.2